MKINNQYQLLQKTMTENDIILMEAAVVERLRRSENINLHPSLVHAPLIYDKDGRKALIKIYDSYVSIAQKSNIPIFICTPSWRANHTRVFESGIDTKINIDSAKFLIELREKWIAFTERIKIGGVIGCKNDCYKPEEGLSISQAEKFHSWQIEQLAQGNVDFLIAETLPMIDEAVGIARAMEKNGLPYFISFVISRDGNILDGTTLSDAIMKIDNNTSVQPAGYMVNCAYPTFLCTHKQPPQIFNRLVGYLGNASSMDHSELEGSEILKVDSIADWGNKMLEFNRTFGIKILGGCCGTGVHHLNFICENRLL